MKRLICMIIFLIWPILSIANPSDAHKSNKKNVIYITLDGVRWQDFFLDQSHFKKFWEKYADRAILYGAPDSNTRMQVASVPVSLPSYQSQMSGAVQACRDNSCGRIIVETFPEKLKHQLNLQKKELAAFGSWYSIAESVEHIEGTIVVNTGNNPMIDPVTGVPDEKMLEINTQQLLDYTDDEYTRYDKYTVAHAMHYLDKYKPRFLWIALNDADEYAHGGNLVGYHATLAYYDDFLDQLFTQLQLYHIENETLVIVTTDHGRNDDWTGHGDPESKQTWAFVLNGQLMPISNHDGIIEYSTLSIRPTIEAAMN